MENFDFLIFRIVVTVRDIEFEPDVIGKGPLKSVLLHLSTYCSSPDGGKVFPGLALLARKTGYDEKTVRWAISTLIVKGWIEPERQRKGHVKGYAFIMDALGLTLEDTKIKRKVATAASPPPPGPQTDTYRDYEAGLPAMDTPASAALESLRLRREARRQKAL